MAGRGYMEMRREIWEKLPEEVLWLILAMLPTRIQVRMKRVCRRSNELFSSRHKLHQLLPSIPLVSVPAFFLHLVGETRRYTLRSSWVIEESGDYYKVPFPNDDSRMVAAFDDSRMVAAFDDFRVVAACNNVYCYRQIGKKVTLWICNPATRTTARLPPPGLRSWGFTAMAFGSTAKRYTLLLGQISFNNITMTLHIYSSESNAWTQIVMTVPPCILPVENGIYSNGRFYWLNGKRYGSIGDTLEFNLVDKSWTHIPSPDPETTTKRFRCKWSWSLSGSDGTITLIKLQDKGSALLWRLDEDHKWSPLHINLPSVVVGVAVNRNGSILVAGEEHKIWIYDREGRVVQSLELPVIDPNVFPEFDPRVRFYSHILASSFESNNLWWPN